MKLAEKFDLPVVTFVDTPGAYPGIDAEQRGQSEAIGRNLFEMAGPKVPVLTCIIGEGGSGGDEPAADDAQYACDAVNGGVTSPGTVGQ